MGALRQALPSKTATRKPAVPETRKLDRFGRDPECPSEKLRAQTNYEADTGYAPAYHAAIVDLTRLSSGAVCYAFVLVVNALSYGRPRSSKDARPTATLPISTAELSELCRANPRDIQRQLAELEDRGMISVKTVKNGTTRYVISLLFSKWQGLEDYAVWKRKQVVEIDEAAETDEAADEEQQEISSEAVHLFKKPAAVKPGKASRAVKVNTGVREFVCQNDSPTVDAVFSAAVQSGRLVVSATFKTSEGEAKGEDKGNAERHGCRALPPNEGIDKPKSAAGPKLKSHPRQAEVVNLFDPLLQKSGSRLLSPDQTSVSLACAELGSMPHDSLVWFVMRPQGRGSRPITGPRAVVSIIREARQNWEAGEREHSKAGPGLRCKCGGEVMDVQSGLCARCLDV